MRNRVSGNLFAPFALFCGNSTAVSRINWLFLPPVPAYAAAMNCIVTAGPTIERLDDVRRLTNFSTGRLGTELANFFTARGHKVALLISESATYAGERRAQTVKTF